MKTWGYNPVADSRSKTGSTPQALHGSFIEVSADIVAAIHAFIDQDEQHTNSKFGIPMALISTVCKRIRALLHGPGGLAILTGAGLSGLTDTGLSRLHLAIADSLGEVVPQDANRQTLVEVSARGHRGSAQARGYQDRAKMLMHTDAGDFSGLVCLSPAVDGGSNLFTNALDIHDHLAQEAPEILALLFGEWHWNVGVLGFPGVNAAFRLPIFSVHGGRLSCRYSSSLLWQGAAAVDEELTDAQQQALDLFENVALREDIVLRHRLSRGEFAWMNNQTVLHGREQFYDHEETHQRRRLLRTWSRSVTSQRSWPRIAAFDDYLFHRLQGRL